MKSQHNLYVATLSEFQIHLQSPHPGILFCNGLQDGVIELRYLYRIFLDWIECILYYAALPFLSSNNGYVLDLVIQCNRHTDLMTPRFLAIPELHARRFAICTVRLSMYICNVSLPEVSLSTSF